MKELSIKEKAKRYDEAIEKGKQILNTPYTAHWDIMKEVVEHLLPELKESEDEKIRKELLNAFQKSEDSLYIVLTPQRRNSFIAWIEKQAEHANFRNKIQIGDKVTRNEAGILVNISQLNRVAKPAKRHGGQKLAVEMKTPEESLGIDSDTYNKIVDECIYGEHNPVDKVKPKFKVKYAGNEYNVFEVKDIAGVTFYGIEDEPNHIDYVQAENCERVNGYSIKESGSPFPTKPAKFSEQNSTWSEEDESRLTHILRLLDVKDDKKYILIFGLNSLQDLEKDIAWLKSLKDKVGCEANCTTTKEQNIYKNGVFQEAEGVRIWHNGHTFLVPKDWNKGEWPLLNKKGEENSKQNKKHLMNEIDALLDWDFVAATKHIQDLGTDIPLKDEEYLITAPVWLAMYEYRIALNKALSNIGAMEIDFNKDFWFAQRYNVYGAWYFDGTGRALSYGNVYNVFQVGAVTL